MVELARSSERLRIRVLGPLEVTRGDQIVSVGGAKPRVVLALLALHPRRVVAADTLIDALWSDEPPKNALGTLQAHISGLRRALDVDRRVSCIINRPPGYVLDLPPDATDVLEFEELVARARSFAAAGRNVECAALYERASALWRGDALADLASERAITGMAAALDEARLVAVEAHIAVELRRGRHGEIIPSLRALLAEHPMREALWASLMLALYRSGRQAEALGAYRSARTTLVESLGIEPGPTLQALEQAVLEQSPALDREAAIVEPDEADHVMNTTVFGLDAPTVAAVLVLADGTEVALTGKVTVGRHPGSRLVVDDPQASRHHATIRPMEGGHIVVDLASTNGTKVGGKLVTEHVLRHGDEIQIGHATLRYVVR